MLSATAFPQSASIEQCQQWAQDNYPLTKRYDLIRQTEGFTLQNLQKGWLPQVGIVAQSTYQSAVPEYPEVLSDIIKQMGTDLKGISPLQYKAAVEVQQTIYDGGAISNSQRVAKASADVQMSTADVQLYALRERINELCFGVLLLDKYLLVNEQRQSTLDANLSKLHHMLDKGIAMQCDVDALKAESLSVRQQRVDLDGQRTALLAVLKLFTGNDISSIESPQIPEPLGLRPEMHLFEAQLKLADARESSLRAALLPRVQLFAHGYYGYLGMNMFRDMMERTPTLNGIVGIKASWNISALYTRRNDIRKIELERQTILNDREVFVFNQNLQSCQEDQIIVRLKKLISEDKEICRLRRSVREATELKLEAGIIDVSTLVSEISRENQAALNQSVHELEMLQHQYKKQIIEGE